MGQRVDSCSTPKRMREGLDNSSANGAIELQEADPKPGDLGLGKLNLL